MSLLAKAEASGGKDGWASASSFLSKPRWIRIVSASSGGAINLGAQYIIPTNGEGASSSETL